MNGGKSNMRTTRVDEMLLTRYLLGKLTEDEQCQVEDRAFADPEHLALLEAAEADLIDAYVRGELQEGDHRAFELIFLTSDTRRTKVEFARSLAKVAAESEPAESGVTRRRSGFEALIGAFPLWNPGLQWAAVVTAMICVAGASWLMVQNSAMRSRVAALEGERRNQELRQQALQQQLNEEPGRVGNVTAGLQQQPSATSPFASLVLVPGLSRDESVVPQIVLTPSMQLARIEIQLEARDDYSRFHAELRTRSGEEILSRSKLPRHRTAAGFSVVMDIPASALAAGEYELALKGILNDQSAQDIGYYYFSVLKR
jgi:hypothetical protein